MLRSALVTLRDRGPRSLASAACSLAAASIERQLLRRRFVERRIYDYRMLLDLEDAGISRSLLLFGARDEHHNHAVVLRAELERMAASGDEARG